MAPAARGVVVDHDQQKIVFRIILGEEKPDAGTVVGGR
jgi:hypothetical protein